MFTPITFTGTLFRKVEEKPSKTGGKYIKLSLSVTLGKDPSTGSYITNNCDVTAFNSNGCYYPSDKQLEYLKNIPDGERVQVTVTGRISQIKGYSDKNGVIQGSLSVVAYNIVFSMAGRDGGIEYSSDSPAKPSYGKKSASASEIPDLW